MPVVRSFDSTMVMLAEALSFPNLLITLHIYSPESARDALLIRSSDFPGFFCILTFCGLFLRFSSFPFLNHLNLSEEYSELVSHRSTSLEPAADSWLFISFNLGGNAGLGSPSAGAGFPRDPRSFFLPFPLPLPSLRSDISLKMSALRGPGWATVTRDKFGPRACRKVCPGREEPVAGLRGGVACRLQGAAWTRSPGAPATSGGVSGLLLCPGSCRCRLWSGLAPVAVSLPYSPKRERCSQSGLCSHLPAAAAAALRSAPAAGVSKAA